MHAAGYEPLNTLKPVADNIWIIDAEGRWLLGMPYPARCTVIRLQSGALWIHAPTALTDELKAELDALGPVAHLIAADLASCAHVPEWQRDYPAALVHALPGIAQRASKAGTPIARSHELTEDAPAAWAGDIDLTIAQGSGDHGEAAFLHRASSTLIVANLIEAVETAMLPAWARPLIWLAGIDDADGKMRIDRRMRYSKAPLAEALERMIAWEPRRLILTHGRWYDRDAVGQLRRAFRRTLRDREWTAAMDRIEADRARKRR
ncbi:DUF4336 domain-containing protein [Roseovarius sp. D0-M9]|uniref:DUF4336 domain-containing protein n=1 Tax=Roseovarius sp. D0-M9 TaxID=3127117 RepID=UPI00301030EB